MQLKCIFSSAKLLKLTFFLPFFALFPIISGGVAGRKKANQVCPCLNSEFFFSVSWYLATF